MADQRDDDPVPPADEHSISTFNRSFPLIALVHLATFCAALVACVDGVALLAIAKELPLPLAQSLAAVVAAILAGGMLGSFLGLGEYRIWRSIVKGAGIGALSGATLLFIYVAPAPIERALAASLVLLLSTIVMRATAA